MRTAIIDRPAPILLPDASALVVGARAAVWLTADGEIDSLSLRDAADRAQCETPIVCHARALARRLGIERLRAYDVLELFAFARPGRFALPTPRGLASVLDLDPPGGLAAEGLALFAIAKGLLEELSGPDRDERSDPVSIAWSMGRAGWPWGPAVLAALGAPQGPDSEDRARRGLQIWRRLPQWSEHAPEPPPGQVAVEPNAARTRLAELIAASVPGKRAEPRPEQSDYASAVSLAFTPREVPEAPNLVLAEAGTGVGKTLGYLAPATLWAELNKGPVWISTFTRNLQHQIDGELDRLYRDPVAKAQKVVLRKGRENYLCLLNLDDAMRGVSLQPQLAVGLGLVARWAAATADGDFTGADFPGWLADLVGRGRSLGLADRRGECIYSACDHYHRCFIEKSVRRARRADIVIANHALVMIQAALGGGDEMHLPTRYVFDEGHHLFEAADGAFAGHLTGAEAAELRRWLIGAETATRSRARGLKRRAEDLIGGFGNGLALIETIGEAARALPGDAWTQRIVSGQPNGPAENFIALVRRQVYARTQSPDSPYSLETETRPPIEGVLEAAATLDAALQRLLSPMQELTALLRMRLDQEAETLDSDTRRRIDALARALTRRGALCLGAWRGMLASLSAETPPEFVDWFAIERQDRRDLDVGMYRHWVDPTIPFVHSLARQAHGIVATSATLTDGTGDPELNWQAAEARTGAVHLPRPALRARVPSPFDHAAQTRVLVVTDVRKDDLDQVAAAYRELFKAANGGALGLFTAIQRLKAVRDKIIGPLESAGLSLYAQHLDGLDVATLIDIFRAEENACLLGTDAVRDGVDVPGRALRLIVFDRVPWPRPDILHRARREAFGKKRYDDMITRLRLKQAYGRLIRRADDCGVFVLLDPMMPSRLAGAFPEGVAVQRTGLAEAVEITSAFLNHPQGH